MIAAISYPPIPISELGIVLFRNRVDAVTEERDIEYGAQLPIEIKEESA